MVPTKMTRAAKQKLIGGKVSHPSKRTKKKKVLTDRRKRMIEEYYVQIGTRQGLRGGNYPDNPRWMEELLQKVNENAPRNTFVSEVDVRLWFKKHPEFFKVAEIKGKKRYKLNQAVLEDSRYPVPEAVPSAKPVPKPSSAEKSNLQCARPAQPKSEKVAGAELLQTEGSAFETMKRRFSTGNVEKVFPSPSKPVDSNNDKDDAEPRQDINTLPAADNEPVPGCSKNMPKETPKEEEKQAYHIGSLSKEESVAMFELIAGIKSENGEHKISFAALRHFAKSMAKATSLAVKGNPPMDLETPEHILDINDYLAETNDYVAKYVYKYLNRQIRRNTEKE